MGFGAEGSPVGNLAGAYWDIRSSVVEVGKLRGRDYGRDGMVLGDIWISRSSAGFMIPTFCVR